MQINGRGFQVRVAEQNLDGVEVGAIPRARPANNYKTTGTRLYDIAPSDLPHGTSGVPLISTIRTLHRLSRGLFADDRSSIRERAALYDTAMTPLL